MKKRLEPLIFLVLALIFGDMTSARASEKLPDGRYQITLRGMGPNLFCFGQISRHGEVRGGRPVYSGQARFNFSLTPNGVLTASGARKADRASLRGQIRDRRSGSGTFEVPTRNCRGTWQVTKIGE